MTHQDITDQTGGDRTTRPQAQPHGVVTRGIHWLSAILIAFGYAKGLNNVGQLADPATFRTEIIFALLLGCVFALRLIWTRLVAGATRLPATAPQWESRAAHTVQTGLYVAVFGIVISGLGIALAFSVPALGGLFMSAMIALHEVTLAALPILLLIHIAGALWHKCVRRDGILESMTGRLPF